MLRRCQMSNHTISLCWMCLTHGFMFAMSRTSLSMSCGSKKWEVKIFADRCLFWTNPEHRVKWRCCAKGACQSLRTAFYREIKRNNTGWRKMRLLLGKLFRGSSAGNIFDCHNLWFAWVELSSVIVWEENANSSPYFLKSLTSQLFGL